MIIRLMGIFAAAIVAPVISYFSGWITMRIDESTEATVGETLFKGFPIWFYEQSAGISIMSGWHLQRYIWNTAVWFAFFVILIWVAAFFGRKRRKE